MRSHQLARLLLSQPDGEVCTWESDIREELLIEQVIQREDGLVVLGLDITPNWPAEVVWTAHDLALRGIVKSNDEWHKAAREAV